MGLVALLVALWIAGRFLRPLRAMNTTAHEISATNLHRRLGIDGPEDELLTGLGRTLDDLFGRPEASFESQHHFVANASHELRTPLAGHRTLLQVALADPDATIEGLRAACEEALQLGDQHEQLIDALLTLANSERGVERREQFDLSEVAESVLLSRRARGRASRNPHQPRHRRGPGGRGNRQVRGFTRSLMSSMGLLVQSPCPGKTYSKW